MSEVINNREYRRETLKELIRRLHDGESVDVVKEDFNKLLEGITVAEISEMEKELVDEGMAVEEIQRLCDVHAAVFKGSIKDIHSVNTQEEKPGHPVDTFKLENRGIEDFIVRKLRKAIESYRNEKTRENSEKLLGYVTELMEIDKHYSRKENLLFPLMEKYKVDTPPKVMWGVDDEIRAAIKEVRNNLKNHEDEENILSKLENVIARINDMIFKEENILLPMVLELFTEDEWLMIEKESPDIGYCFIDKKDDWEPERSEAKEKEQEKTEKPADGYIKLETGILELNELEQLLNMLPIDITFIDKDDVVKYFSKPRDRIFSRTKAIIGRKVQNCHPPASVHVVEGILNDFKAGKKDNEDFWINMGPVFAYIRYFAVRDESGNYIGALEVTQDIKAIQKIQGEKRIISN